VQTPPTPEPAAQTTLPPLEVKPPEPSEPPIKPAPVTGAAQTTVSTRRQAPDIVNKPVIFPFDETPDTGAPDAKTHGVKADAPVDVFTVPESKTPEAHKPIIDEPEQPPLGDSAQPAAAQGSAPATAPNAPPKSGQVRPGPGKKTRKGLIVVVDILIVIAVILIFCVAIVQFAPGSGASELILKAAHRIQQITGFADEGSSAAEGGDAEVAATDDGFIMPISDGDALVSSQLYNNYNIHEVKYDPSAAWQEGAAYTIEGAAAAKPIEDDHWMDGAKGPVLYDESAVAAVIKFDSGLVEYINQGTSSFLDTMVVGSPAEKKLAGYVASVSNISVDALGIGNIRKNGDDLYVWSRETVTETMGGAPVQRTFFRLYLLTPDVDTYKVSDYEDIG
jgi:hypothetical protein